MACFVCWTSSQAESSIDLKCFLQNIVSLTYFVRPDVTMDFLLIFQHLPWNLHLQLFMKLNADFFMCIIQKSCQQPTGTYVKQVMV